MPQNDLSAATLFSRPRPWVFAAVFALSAAGGVLGCGEASLVEFTPTPTPPDGPSTRFRQGVLPAIAVRDCASNGICHSVDGGAPAGDLGLGGSDITPRQIYDNIIAGGALNGTDAGFDVDLDSPADSLLLTKPLASEFPDHTGGDSFSTTSDPGYLSILGWIESGAPFN